MKIQDPDYVLRLWADWYRPRLKVRQIRPEKSNWPTNPEPKDDRRVQARVTVECTPGYRKAMPVLLKALVREQPLEQRQELVYMTFREALILRLDELPISVPDPWRVVTDFEVTIAQAVNMLASAGTPLTRRTIERWVSEGLIVARRQGKYTFVRWSKVVERAPRTVKLQPKSKQGEAA